MANEIPTNDGMNIETLKINIDVDSNLSKAGNELEVFEERLSSLEEKLKKANKTFRDTSDTQIELGKAIKNVARLTSVKNKSNGETTEFYTRKEKDSTIKYKIIDDSYVESTRTYKERQPSLGIWGEGIFEKPKANAKLLSEYVDRTGRLVQNFSEELDDVINKYQVINGEVTRINKKHLDLKKQTNDILKNEENTEKAKKKRNRMDSISWAIGNSLKYSAIYGALNLVTKGLSEGIEQAALFDDRINDSISNIIGSSKQLTNQIGAAGGELIVSFEPVIVRLIEWLTIGADKVTQFFAALNGKDTYDKAVTQAYDFAKSIRGAYGGIGIDELNIFGSGANGGLLSDVQYVEESLDGWALGISEFRKEMQPTVDWVNENLDAVLTTAISIGTTIAAIKFANSFKDALNKDLATSLVTGSKDLLGNLQTIAAIGTITLGISFLADENKENDLLGSFLLALGTGLGLTKAATALFSVSTGTALSVAIPVAVTFFLLSSFDFEKGFGEMAVDTMTLNDQKLKAGMNYYNDSALPPSTYHTTDVLSKYYPNQVSGSTDVPYYSFADVINSSRSAEEQNSEKQDEMIYYLAQIASKNPNIILADDDIGRAYERYVYSRGVPMNGGAYANAD